MQLHQAAIPCCCAELHAIHPLVHTIDMQARQTHNQHTQFLVPAPEHIIVSLAGLIAKLFESTTIAMTHQMELLTLTDNLQWTVGELDSIGALLWAVVMTLLKVKQPKRVADVVEDELEESQGPSTSKKIKNPT
jgi:hypothetical protein